MPLVSPLLVLTEGGGWELGIGDASLLGWTTVVAYFAAAYLCFSASQRAKHAAPGDARLSVAWLVLCAMLVALGINKQLDLQSLLTVVGRRLAMREGWYEQRRLYQAWFVRGIVVVGVAATSAALWLLRRHLRALWLAGVGVTFLVVFVAIRAASFHHVDVTLRRDVLGVPVNVVFEMAGILCVAFAAARGMRHEAR